MNRISFLVIKIVFYLYLSSFVDAKFRTLAGPYWSLRSRGELAENTAETRCAFAACAAAGLMWPTELDREPGEGPWPSHASLCSCSFTGCTSPGSSTSRTIGGASPLSRQWSPGNLDTTRPPRPSFASRRRKVASTDAGDSSSSSSNQSSFTGCPMSPPSSVDGSFSSMKSSPCDEPWMSDSLGERRQVTFTDELAGPQHGASASFRRRRVGGDVSTDGAIVPSGLTGVHVVLQTAAARATKD